MVISNSTCLLLVYKKAFDFYILTLYPATLLYSCFFWEFFRLFIWIFYVDDSIERSSFRGRPHFVSDLNRKASSFSSLSMMLAIAYWCWRPEENSQSGDGDSMWNMVHKKTKRKMVTDFFSVINFAQHRELYKICFFFWFSLGRVTCISSSSYYV